MIHYCAVMMKFKTQIFSSEKCLWKGRVVGLGWLCLSKSQRVNTWSPEQKWPQSCRRHFQIQFNSLSPGRFEQKFRYAIFKLVSVTDGWGISWKIPLRWMPLYLTDDKSTLVQVMAWCRQATSHYLSQCWPRSLSPYGVARPRRVKEWRWYFHSMKVIL